MRLMPKLARMKGIKEEDALRDEQGQDARVRDWFSGYVGALKVTESKSETNLDNESIRKVDHNGQEVGDADDKFMIQG